MSSGLADFEISVGPSGTFNITLNNVDVSESVAEFSVQCKPGQPPVVSLFQIGKPGTITGEGIVRVVSPSEDNVSLIDFLNSIDPVNLSQKVIDSSSFSDDPVEIALEILKGWAAHVNAS